MRFTFINPKRKSAPSFKARYDAFVFASLAIAQILSISFSILLLWHFLPIFEPVLLSVGVLFFLALAFYFAYSSAQSSHIVSLVSIFGLQAISLQYFPQWVSFSIYSIHLVFTIDDYLLVLGLIDFFVITLIFYLDTSFAKEESRSA